MAQNKKGTFYVVRIERKNNSYYGNPKYQLTLRDVDTMHEFVATTASNAMCAYKIGYSTEHTYITATYHYTQTGNAIITSIDLLTKEQSDDIEQRLLNKSEYIGHYKIVQNFADLPKVGQKHPMTNEYVFSVELQSCDNNFAYYRVWYATEDDFGQMREAKFSNCRYFSYAVRKR